MKLKSFVAMLVFFAIVGLTAGASDFEAAEQRAMECCKKINGPITIGCSLGVVNAMMKFRHEANKEMGLAGPNGMSHEQKENMKAVVKEGLPLLRSMGLTNSTGCITKWQNHSECCRVANIPSACVYLCDYRDVKNYYEEGDAEALVNREADMYGQCQPHTETINQCIYAD